MSLKPQTKLRAEATPTETKIETTVQVLTVEPGLYSVGVTASEVVRGNSGLVMPCIRLDPIRPGSASMGFAYLAALSDDSLLIPNQPAAYLRVHGGDATVLLTIYRLGGGMKAPELRITRMQADAVPSSAAEPQPQPNQFSEPLTLLAHIERVGDVSAEGGVWVGQAGAGGAVEGFALAPGGGLALADIEYQAVLGADWTTPWLSGGEFCGSRGLSLALLGVRIRLVGNAAKEYSCLTWGRFMGAGEAGPFADGEVCLNAHAPLEGLRVAIVKRDQARQPSKAPGKMGKQPDTPTQNRRPAGKSRPPAAQPKTALAAKPARDGGANRAASANLHGQKVSPAKPVITKVSKARPSSGKKRPTAVVKAVGRPPGRRNSKKPARS